MNALSLYFHKALHFGTILVVVLAMLLALPLFAIVGRFLMPAAFAVVMGIFVASLFSRRLATWLENLGRQSPA